MTPTDKDNIHTAALKYHFDVYNHVPDYNNAVKDAFKAGVAWRDANHSPKVLALVEALEIYATSHDDCKVDDFNSGRMQKSILEVIDELRGS